MAERDKVSLAAGIVLADHFTLGPFALFVDHLRLAADEGDRSRPIRCSWQVMAARESPVRASCGVSVNPTSGLLDPRALDYVVVVGGLLHAGRQVDAATLDYLRQAARAGTTLVGLCTGSFVLARAGLLDGRTACVSWLHHQDFVDAFPGLAVVADRLFLVDGDRITCAGGAGAADLATFLVRRHLGESAAQKSRQVMQLDAPRGGEMAQPHPPLGGEVGDNLVRRALLLMEQNLSRPLPIGAIAAKLGLSPRQLERRFQAALGERPAASYRALRLRYARFLLDTTDRSVTAIALDAGFSDCAHFSRQFKAEHGVAPSGARGRPGGGHDSAGPRVFP
jgi:transcriptional regulator GlxA family with amidase domain